MDKQRAQELIDKYLNGTSTSEEKSIVERWYNREVDAVESNPIQGDLDTIGMEIYQSISIGREKKRKYYYRWMAAAIILIALSVGINYQFSTVKMNQQQIIANEIHPGGNKAYLTLSDGERISLTDAENGDVAKQSGITITKSFEGQLIYSTEPTENSELIKYNNISTPRGGQFKVVLPDGSTVWLNSESSLTYPTTFSSLDKRRVELEGEAYFEIAHNKKKPFIVHTISSSNGMSQDVEVLGTHFNINGYENEAVIKTTLLEGSIRVLVEQSKQSFLLKPGQQSKLSNKELLIELADIDSELAWKNGDFIFNNESLSSIMKKIERWYDVEVVYQTKITDRKFTGAVSRSKNLSAVLQIMELTGKITFKIEGRRVIIIE